MKYIFIVFAAGLFVFCSCKGTRKIQVAVAPKDTTASVVTPKENILKEDSLAIIKENYNQILKNRIDFNTFSAKMDVDYRDASGKKNSVTAHLRMVKDSVIWIMISGPFGIEGLRALITSDTIRVLDKLNKTYTVRSVGYLQEMTELPLDLHSLQDLLIGNAVFLDSNIVSFKKSEGAISLLSSGSFFKNRFTVADANKAIINSKLDDLDGQRSRTCYLTYADYDTNNGLMFSRDRSISVTDKKKVDIRIQFKQYDFNETLSFPFNVPSKYSRN
ncbi:MAG: DUF4292 domain-containing protein [Bacteroidetes bacterium]|nr:DUF4292 domain-containing protein [Bacteroidota bacterium]